jgi:hypothetical protein
MRTLHPPSHAALPKTLPHPQAHHAEKHAPQHHAEKHAPPKPRVNRSKPKPRNK